MTRKLRLLPVLILVAVMGVKLGGLWRDAGQLVAELTVAPAQAQETAPAEEASGEAVGKADGDQAAGPAGEAPNKTPPVAALDGSSGASPDPNRVIGLAGGDESTLRLLLRQAIEGLVEEEIEAVLSRRRTSADTDNVYSESEVQILQSLARRRDALEQREGEITMRENLLRAAEKRIDQQIAELKKIEDTIQALLKQYDAQEEAKMKSLVKIYESMKPKDAARIMEQLEMPILLEVSARMREQKMAAILAQMNSEKAKAVTVELATRRQLPTVGG
jgi:flagellar motility protein MotE (MotC chaperone)